MIDATGFSARLDALGPFEPGPHLAVAVSGGSDSLALALLAHEWAGARGGRITALTVDHGLRKESFAEARQVGQWLRHRGIAHRILAWEGDKPKKGLMAAARAARYGLLEGWCAKAGVLHLLLAHQQEDQAETFLMRLARGSGIDGLSAMAPVLCTRHVRLLRPLLDVPRASLREYLSRQGQGWIDDPSNLNLAFERVRLRSQADSLAGMGLTPNAVAASAGKLARQRRFFDEAACGFLARHVRLDRAGFAWLSREALLEPFDLGLAGLSRLLTTIAGQVYPPAEERLETLLRAMEGAAWRGGTLGGCRLAPRQGRILIVREAQSCAPPVRLLPGQAGRWDGRFAFVAGARRGLYLGALGPSDAERLARHKGEYPDIPPLAWSSLPALRDARGVFAVPALGYKRTPRGSEPLAELSFAPQRALSGPVLLLS